MNSKIVIGGAYYLLPVLLVFSLYLLFKGHDQPGGGFVAGLTASIGLVLYSITHGRKKVMEIIPFGLAGTAIIGISLIMLTGLIGLATGDHFFEAKWFKEDWPVVITIGTPIIFDIGVYMIVVGITTGMVINMSKE